MGEKSRGLWAPGERARFIDEPRKLPEDYRQVTATICECGAVLLAGDWPFCPHGQDHRRD